MNGGEHFDAIKANVARIRDEIARAKSSGRAAEEGPACRQQDCETGSHQAAFEAGSDISGESGQKLGKIPLIQGPVIGTWWGIYSEIRQDMR